MDVNEGGCRLSAIGYQLSAYRYPQAPSRLPLVILSDSPCVPLRGRGPRSGEGVYYDKYH